MSILLPFTSIWWPGFSSIWIIGPGKETLFLRKIVIQGIYKKFDPEIISEVQEMLFKASCSKTIEDTDRHPRNPYLHPEPGIFLGLI